MKNFYDRVAKQFGGYAYGTNKPKRTTKCPRGDPEKDFKAKLVKLSGKNVKALDVGCGDCKFAFEVSPNFKLITGIDNSKELLAIAEKKKAALKNKKVLPVFGNAAKMAFPDKSFDVVFCRRGPSYYKEYQRVLKSSGYYSEIGIGEKDTMDLKKVFGRGQDYGKWNNSRLEKDVATFKKLGLKIILAKDYLYSEYYPTYESMDEFLQGVPIFEDFDSKKDRKYLEGYCQKFQTKEGIVLPRHRVVYVLQKQ